MSAASVDLFFTSPPYADARSYSRIHPDHHGEWFLPFAEVMFGATANHGSLVLNIKNRVVNRGPDFELPASEIRVVRNENENTSASAG